MIKTYSAYTEEIDDIEIALQDINEQLDLEGKLLKNTVAICSCNNEYVFSGVAEKICGSFPFDVVGIITTAQAINSKTSPLLFTIMVLTSDDVEFKTVLTDSLTENNRPVTDIIKDSYIAAVSEKPDPSLIFSYAPYIMNNSGDDYVRALTEVSNGVPCFGTLAVDDSDTFIDCFSLYNGIHYNDRMVLVLFCGEVNPKFYIASMSPEKILGQSALITSSEGHVMKCVNDKPVIEYFKSHGLVQAAETQYAMTALPFMIDYNDGTPMISRVFITLNQNNEAICAGAMPEGATLHLGVFEKDDVIKTTSNAVQEAMVNTDLSNMIIYSCVSRSMILVSDIEAELDTVKKIIGNKFNFMASYSGGEICPTFISENTAVNRFHNNTLIICVF